MQGMQGSRDLSSLCHHLQNDEASSLSPFPAVSLGFTILGEIFTYVTIEVVTFRLRSWCVLGVFLLPAFTRLENECQDLFESLRWNACVHILDLRFILSSERVIGNGVRTRVDSKGKAPSTGSSEEDRTCDAASRKTASPTH